MDYRIEEFGHIRHPGPSVAERLLDELNKDPKFVKASQNIKSYKEKRAQEILEAKERDVENEVDEELLEQAK